MNKIVVLAVAIAGVLVLSGCMAGYESTYDHPRRQMTIQDIDTLTAQGVSDSLIVAQIRATHSVFRLSTQEILQLKNSGVSDAVIAEMISTKDRVKTRSYGYHDPWSYSYFDLGFNWWGYPYYYPAYSTPFFYRTYYSYPFGHFGGYGGRGGRSRR